VVKNASIDLLFIKMLDPYYRISDPVSAFFCFPLCLHSPTALVWNVPSTFTHYHPTPHPPPPKLHAGLF
jgi:hypothetical protein